MPVKAVTATTLHIPDILRNWPWQRMLSPYYAVCKAESAAWCDSFNAFSPKAQAKFNRCDFNLLASLAFPRLDKDGCRVACDLMNLFFLFDEYSDVTNAPGVRKQADIIGVTLSRLVLRLVKSALLIHSSCILMLLLDAQLTATSSTFVASGIILSFVETPWASKRFSQFSRHKWLSLMRL
ncbi:hypothetical protein QCA50_006283 [Cerrena zonata]|uniref:Uncharacterized protein n=1 Tax=Cerrena zonata TaxID=2478898 RepID=A0AAW0GPL2_9APHY